MKAKLQNITVKDIAYLIDSSCLRAPVDTSLEKLADMLCSSDRNAVYLENDEGRLESVIQAKQIAMKLLELSRQKDDADDMLPTMAYILNAQTGKDLAEPVVAVEKESLLATVLERMDHKHIRAIAVVDDAGGLVGTLEAKKILSHYLQRKAEASL